MKEQICRRGIAALLLAALLSVPCMTLAETIGYVTSTGLNIRKSPSSTAEVLRCAENGDKLIILRTEGDWYYVQFNSVVTGYVAKKFVSLKKAETTTTTTSTGGTTASSTETLTSIDALGDAPATSREGDRGNDVKKLQQALKILGYYSGTCDGIFGEMTTEAVKKFQKARGMSQDGIAGKVTIKLLFGENASNSGSYKTEKLSWNNGGSTFIPKGATFTVKDVRTGTTFTVRRWSGYNHYDCEPLTSADTAKMKAVYGGSWSWARRPILLLYGDRVIAASMNGMPHGTTTIDNGFDGHFCIHLLDSKTHESDKVDADHQNAVAEAARASW